MTKFGKKFKLMRELPDMRAGAIFILSSDDNNKLYLYFNEPRRIAAYKFYLDELNLSNFFYWFEPVREQNKVV